MFKWKIHHEPHCQTICLRLFSFCNSEEHSQICQSPLHFHFGLLWFYTAALTINMSLPQKNGSKLGNKNKNLAWFFEAPLPGLFWRFARYRRWSFSRERALFHHRASQVKLAYCQFLDLKSENNQIQILKARIHFSFNRFSQFWNRRRSFSRELPLFRHCGLLLLNTFLKSGKFSKEFEKHGFASPSIVFNVASRIPFNSCNIRQSNSDQKPNSDQLDSAEAGKNSFAQFPPFCGLALRLTNSSWLWKSNPDRKR